MPIILALLAVLLLPAPVRAQLSDSSSKYPLISHYPGALPVRLQQRVALRAGARPLEEVLRDIARQAGLSLVFQTDRVAALPSRSLSLDGVTAAAALQRALEGTGLAGYLMPDGRVLIADDGEVEAPALLQTIRGRVVDQVSQTPLPGATVVVVASDPLIGTTTDAEGRFVLTRVPLGRHDLQVSYLGYEPVLIQQVLVTSSKEVVLDVALREQILTGEEVVVVPKEQAGSPLNDQALVSARAFSVEETRRYAGGLDDPARLASAFAGVTTGNVEENALIIRGNAPKGVAWRLEGVEIPNPNHFAGLSIAGGGGLTLFSSQLLSDSDFFTGAFPAEYGNALAGVFDMSLRTGNASRREHAVQLGVVGLDVASEGPFKEGAPASYLFNYRFSTLTLLQPLLPVDDPIRYQDLSFKINLPTPRAGRFELWGLGGLDYQRLRAEQDTAAWTYEIDREHLVLDLGVGAAGLTHHLVLGRNTYLRSFAAVTANRTDWHQRRLDDAIVPQDQSRISDLSSRFILGTSVNHRTGSRHVNRTGVTARYLSYDFDFEAAPAHAEPLVTVAGGSGRSTLLQAYTQSRFDLTGRLAVNLGVHAQYFDLTGRASVEPRTALQWTFVPGQALSLGYGLHSQIEDLRIYFVQPTAGPVQPNRRLGFTKAHHVVLGYGRPLGPATRLKVEAYYQALFDAPVIPDSSFSLLNFEQDFAFDEVLVNRGAGTNVGVELTVERTFRDGYYYLLTGSVFRSRYRGGDTRWRPTRFDRTFALNLLAGKEFVIRDGRQVFGINGRFATAGGQRYSPIDFAASRAAEEVVYDASRAFTLREPATFYLDVTLTYRRNHARLSQVWALQVRNALAARNFAHDYNYATGTVDEVREALVLPMLSYKIEF